MMKTYILDAKGIPVAEPDTAKWGQWFENSGTERRVARDQIGESLVSTVFLSLDHSWVQGPPVLWETMVFGGPLDQECDRCGGGREQAEAMHSRMVEKVKSSIKEKE